MSYPYERMVVVLFGYGLAFFIMGFAILGEALRPQPSKLAYNLRFLAAFGLMHGVVEWAEMFGLIFDQAGLSWATGTLELLNSGLSPLSFIPLLIFGTRSLSDNVEGTKHLWLALPSLVAAWLLVSLLPFVMPHLAGEQGVDQAFLQSWQGAWARYLLYLPGCLLAALGLFSYRRQFIELGMPNIARYASLGGGAFLLNAFVAGMVVPTSPFPPAAWLNYDTFTRFVGVPPHVFRALSAVVIAFAVVEMLRFFGLAAQRSLAEAQRQALALEERAHLQAEEWGESLAGIVKERTEQLEALATINAELSALQDLQTLLRLVVEKARQLLGVDVATVSLLEEGKLVIYAVTGANTKAFEEVRMSVGHGVAGRSVALVQPVVVEDYPADQSITHELDALMEEEGLKSHMAVPLKIGDRVLGAIYVAHRAVRRFQPEEMELLSRLGHQAAIALENARLYQQVQEMAVLAERERLAREMHDSAAQALGLLRLGASTVSQFLKTGNIEGARNELEQMDKAAEAAHADVREAILGLSSTALPRRGLIPMLRDYLSTFSIQNQIEAGLLVEPGQGCDLSPASDVQVIRILQEALTNVRKHAQATCVKVRIAAADGGNIRIVVEDNGHGFDPSQVARIEGQHYGLSTMKERAESVGGTLQVHSAPGKGTRVVLCLPRSLKEVG
ncbi:MAG: GAF domain-containing sensor histidine kinase [Dehalococcoidia bacterium]|nr:GAF domain-containing sensor histidine kinase [Dehalococcoidia bacterium]